MKKRLFVDMDGTLAVFVRVPSLDYLYVEGYFRNLDPHSCVVDAVRQLVVEDQDQVEVFLLSAYLTDSDYALQEKQAWVKEYLPELDEEHCLFIPNGSDKRKYVPGGIRPDDCLLDDFTKNLLTWSETAKGIKLLNAINNSHGTWQGDTVLYDIPADQLSAQLKEIVLGEQLAE